MDEDDNWQDDNKDMEGIVLNYYFDLFKSSCPSDFVQLLEAIVLKVSQDMNVRLTGEFQDMEVHKGF